MAQAKPADPWAGRASGGDLAKLPSLPIVRTVEEAEAEARTFPKSAAPDSARAARYAAVAGTSERRCAVVARDVSAMATSSIRTGEFTIGAQIGSLTAGRAGKIWWAPLHDPSLGAHALLVRAALLGPTATPADTVRFTSGSYGWPMEGGPGSKALPEAFFPSGFTLPKAGAWVVVATAGNDWGCLVMSAR